MSESTEQSPAIPSVTPQSSSSPATQSSVVIDFQDLTDTQKMTLLSIPLALVLQLIYLVELKFVTDFFKGMISGEGYKPITDYVRSFVSTFVPYLLVVFLFFALYSAYVVLVNDVEHVKLLNKIYFYLFIGLVVDFVLFFMSVSTSDPYTTEFFLFLFVVLVMLLIAWIPFGVFDVLEGRKKQ